jgi:hypothetical protein
MKRDLILVAIAMFAWGLGEGMFLYFQPLYLEELGANPIMIGTILGESDHDRHDFRRVRIGDDRFPHPCWIPG